MIIIIFAKYSNSHKYMASIQKNQNLENLHIHVHFFSNCNRQQIVFFKKNNQNSLPAAERQLA